ncbi:MULTISPECIES: ribosome recycling factor [Thermoactinomyces]|jgi:ribosome recycling factor|uniref:Ribosome-recycling factor n=1 Tax=Thermoactinomyces vulgaris TaxID=2026 RepID=A0ABS0QI98_THEVU|nr:MULTISPECIES: ribosome recycling factor [Thermoactinomyces]KFZ39716.1 ribosome recycling factor [Thermoactinomyces sp. Gus2-1]KYQ87076.1 ribosome recycling factor [Thermoactinomyces sp. AS95]MBA4551538.1 ribosome recycling factor [Thermoactinomyces vulgaris]MBA4597519.1 ribosome recycling factor [Thermoactinomyces vulgaris]MBH8582660.1 ribosome recycling factor [Thermoactinomyces sp. CICC 10735]
MDEVKKQAQEKMEKALQVLKKDLVSIRAGRANPSLLDKVVVEYYGSEMPVNQVANISTPDPRTLLIQPWDKSVLPEIERGILKSELGLNPNNDGSVIRITIPALTEERRNELVKLVRKTGEDAKVAIRNIRRDANDTLKKMEKNGEIPEDTLRRGQDEVQKLTDQYIKKVDDVVADKEKEILEI